MLSFHRAKSLGRKEQTGEGFSLDLTASTLRFLGMLVFVSATPVG